MNTENFISYLQSNNLAQSTQNAYLKNLNLFLKWIEKEAEQTTKKDVLKYLEYLQTTKSQGNITRRNSLIAINHYFTHLHKAERIATNPAALIKIRGTKKRSLYRTYTPEELEQLNDNYYELFVRNYDNKHIPKNQRQNSFLCRNRNAAILSLLIYQGLKTGDINKMFLEDIDLTKATIKIKGSKKSNPRTLPLKATQIGLLIHYLNEIRPLFFNYCTETDKLFFALPASGKKSTNSQNLMYVFKPLTKQVKTIDRHFLNFQQVRASVITAWLKTEGLRKAQHLAGHRNINSTEEYLPNQIEGLTEDISKFNPF
jgi:site-specific recombinase XerD